MVCDKNCENCKYDDCICESEDYSDIDFVDKEIEKDLAEVKAIEKGTYKVWRYNHSERGKANLKKYRQSEKGKAMERRKTQKRIASGKNAEYCRNYYRRKKERMLLEKELNKNDR